MPSSPSSNAMDSQPSRGEHSPTPSATASYPRRSERAALPERTHTSGDTNDETRGGGPGGATDASPLSPRKSTPERTLETRNVRCAHRSKSHPHRYSARPCTVSAHGSTARCVKSPDPGYSKLTTRRSRIPRAKAVAASSPVKPSRITGADTSSSEDAAALASTESARTSPRSHACAASESNARSVAPTSMSGAKESRSML